LEDAVNKEGTTTLTLESIAVNVKLERRYGVGWKREILETARGNVVMKYARRIPSLLKMKKNYYDDQVNNVRENEENIDE